MRSDYFCGSCIQKAFTTIQKVEDGKVKHYCPACRHVIPSKRHIVKDSNFDDIIRALKCSRDDAQPEEKIDITIYQQIHRARTQEMKSYQAANKERILSQPYRAPTTSSGTTKRSSVGIVIAGGGQKRGRKSGSSSVAERVQQPHVEETTSYLGLVNFSLKYYNAQVLVYNSHFFLGLLLPSLYLLMYLTCIILHCLFCLQNLNDENLNAKYSLLRPYVRADCSATMLDLKLLLCSYFTDRHENTVDLYVWNAQHVSDKIIPLFFCYVLQLQLVIFVAMHMCCTTA